jgi:hypothetical protein
VSTLQAQQTQQAERLGILTAQLGTERLRHQLARSHAQNAELLERINEVSFVGNDLRKELSSFGTAPPAHPLDLPKQPDHPGAPPRGDIDKRVWRDIPPLYHSYPATASVDVRHSLPLDALQPRVQSATSLLARSIDAAAMITMAGAQW